ncbi:MAG: hypothetical protein Q8Q14_04225 [Gemmatimonadales bacterium]|nr:hypothetical protein [Gemmatimonadales bacterium]
MVGRRFLLVSTLALSVVRCADQPTAIALPPAPQFVGWASGDAPHLTAMAERPNRNGVGGPLLSPPLSLDTYSISFWAVRGESRSVRINYQSADGDVSNPFLALTITDPVFVPGMGDLAAGDSVLITVGIDTTKLGVSLEPSGTQFGAPSQLKIWYGGAGGDLNGDAQVDSTDAYIESQLLSVWYREGQSPWSSISAAHSLEEKSFTTELQHFSEYSLGYVLDWVVSW